MIDGRHFRAFTLGGILGLTGGRGGEVIGPVLAKEAPDLETDRPAVLVSPRQVTPGALVRTIMNDVHSGTARGGCWRWAPSPMVPWP